LHGSWPEAVCEMTLAGQGPRVLHGSWPQAAFICIGWAGLEGVHGVLLQHCLERLGQLELCGDCTHGWIHGWPEAVDPAEELALSRTAQVLALGRKEEDSQRAWEPQTLR